LSTKQILNAMKQKTNKTAGLSPRVDYSRSNGGHMTQAVWANSYLLGCAARPNVQFTIAGTTYSGTYWICQYGKKKK